MFLDFDVFDLEFGTRDDPQREAALRADDGHRRGRLSFGVASHAMQRHGNDFNFQVCLLSQRPQPRNLKRKFDGLTGYCSKLAKSQFDHSNRGRVSLVSLLFRNL